MSSSAPQPPIVQTFVQTVSEFVADLGGTLRPTTTADEAQSTWFYEVDGPAEKANLFIHQTHGSLETDTPVYRARLFVPMETSEMGAYLRGKGSWSNRYAGLGAIIDSGQGVAAVSQATIEEPDLSILASIMALAAVHGAEGLEHSVRNAMSGFSPPVMSLSSWGDLEFEQIQYRNAHLTSDRLSRRTWRRTLPGSGVIELTAVDNNPYWRGGLLVLLRIPKSELKIEGAAPIETINFCDWYYGVTPMFGGWCDDQDELVFVSFYPNMLNGLADLEDYILRWARNRIWYADLLVGEAREMESSPSS